MKDNKQFYETYFLVNYISLCNMLNEIDEELRRLESMQEMNKFEERITRMTERAGRYISPRVSACLTGEIAKSISAKEYEEVNTRILQALKILGIKSFGSKGGESDD